MSLIGHHEYPQLPLKNCKILRDSLGDLKLEIPSGREFYISNDELERLEEMNPERLQEFITQKLLE